LRPVLRKASRNASRSGAARVYEPFVVLMASLILLKGVYIKYMPRWDGIRRVSSSP
jgi:hypothetical protein